MVGCVQEEYTLLRNVHCLWATRDGLVINTMGQKSGHPHNLTSQFCISPNEAVPGSNVGSRTYCHG